MPGTGGVGRGARMNEYEPWQSVKQDASHQQDTRRDSLLVRCKISCRAFAIDGQTGAGDCQPTEAISSQHI